MNNFLKKVIAQSTDDLQIISAICAESKVKISDIKYLPSTKIFLLSVLRIDKETDSSKPINSVIKFEFIESSKSKNINQSNVDLTLELLAIDYLKNKKNFKINLIFKNNAHIALSTEIIDITLEDQTDTEKNEPEKKTQDAFVVEAAHILLDSIHLQQHTNIANSKKMKKTDS